MSDAALAGEIECARVGIANYLAEQEQTEVARLLEMAEYRAAQRYDGHLTIMRFTTGWKVMFGTPDLDGGTGRDEVADLTGYPTLAIALRVLLERTGGI